MNTPCAAARLGRRSRPLMPLDRDTRSGTVNTFINHKET
jgi:hypothetical protein